MEEIVRIMEIESCLAIYSYLMIFGMTTPAKLREVTGQSKATMFRNLARLVDAKILRKTEVNCVDDKRYSLHYFISQNLMDLAKGLYSEKLARYADSVEKSEIVREWMSNIESLPYLLHQYASQFITLKAQSSPNDESACKIVSKFVTFRIGDIQHVGEIQKQLSSIVNSIDEEQKGVHRDWKQPLAQPVSINISVVACDPQELCDESKALTVSSKC